jgi:hypothetical protein
MHETGHRMADEHSRTADLSPADRPTADLVELHQLCSRYMAFTSQFVEDRWLDVFTPDAEYNAFGTPYN